MSTYRKGERGKYQLVVSKKGWEKLKQELKTITRKTTPMSFDERIQKLGEIQRGWINAFRMASIQNKLAELALKKTNEMITKYAGIKTYKSH